METSVSSVCTLYEKPLSIQKRGMTHQDGENGPKKVGGGRCGTHEPSAGLWVAGERLGLVREEAW